MNNALSAASYISKAQTALAGGRLLLEAGDNDGACSRAYYAMFDAAHAALFALGVEEATAPIKTHNGLIAKFGRHLVLGKHLAATHGEALNTVQRFRQFADHTGEPVSSDDAQWSVAKAKALVEIIRSKFVK